MARKTVSKRRSSTKRKTASARPRKKKFIQRAIKRPGALSRSKRKGESTVKAARRLKKSGTTLQKRQANFYLNVLRPASRRRKKR